MRKDLHLKNKLNNGISKKLDHVGSDAHGDRGSVIERDVFEQSGLVEDGKQPLTYEEVFALVDAHSVIPYRGSHGLKGLTKQFQATAMERVFKSFPKGTITAEDLGARIAYLLDMNTDEDILVDQRRVYREVAGDFYTDRKYHVDWQQRAIAYRLAVEQIVGGFPTKDLDGIRVIFSPVITSPDEILVYQTRTDLFSEGKTEQYNGTIEFDGTRVPSYGDNEITLPSEGSKLIEIIQTQYRVIVADSKGRLTEQGRLAFIHASSLEKRFNDTDFHSRFCSGLLDVTYPSSFFDERLWFSNRKPQHIVSSIYAAMPSDLALPSKEAFIYHDEFYPKVTDAPPSEE